MTSVESRSWAWGLLVGACLAALACGSLHSPTEPKPNTQGSSGSVTGDPNGPIIGAPAPAATPTPTPSPDAGQPSPSPATGGEGATECGQPLPPPISTFNVNVHLRGTENWLLDSTPIVGPDLAYCKTIGFTDSRSYCPVRPEGNPQRSACELYAVGRAKDTNRPGPTWYLNGHFCTGKASGCENNGDNQYQLNTYVSGTFRACAASGVCGEVDVQR
jgi:hypothetical protein